MSSTDEDIEGEAFGDATKDILLLGTTDVEKKSSRKRAVLLSNQIGVDPINVPSADVMNSRGSLAWDRILSGQTGNPWQHLRDGLFGFMENIARSARSWPKDVIWLMRTQAFLFVILIGGAVGVTVCTAINTFNMQMEFTFDKLIGGAYPAASSVVGTVDLGWFLAGALWWGTLIFGIQMLFPYYYLTAYIKEQIFMRKDHVYAIVMAGMLSMFIIVALGVIGATNVLLIVLVVASFVGTYLKNNLTIPIHYANSFSFLNEMFPVGFYGVTEGVTEGVTDEGEAAARYAVGTTFQDYEGVNGRNEAINAQDGPAKQSSLAFSKQVVDYVAKSREDQGNPIMSSLEDKKHATALRHYASAFSHSINAYLWAIFDEILPAMSYIVIFIVYYATALQNDSKAFKWNVHFFFWWLFVSLLVDYIVTRYHWSNANQAPVKHTTFKRQRAIGLRINWITLKSVQWAYWMVSFVLCAIILLAPTRNLVTTLPPY